MARTDEAIAHEEGLGRFISSEWRARYRDSLDNERLRQKMLFKLDHFFHLDERFAEPVPTPQQTSDFLIPALRALGAPKTCHVVSNDRDLDGRTMPLGEAISVVVDDGLQTGTFISCIPGVLAYFHDEEHDNRFILHRQP